MWKTLRKRYTKSKQTRKIRKMRKMKTRKMRGGIDYLNRYIPSFTDGLEFIPSLDKIVRRGYNAASELVDVATSSLRKNPELMGLIRSANEIAAQHRIRESGRYKGWYELRFWHAENRFVARMLNDNIERCKPDKLKFYNYAQGKSIPDNVAEEYKTRMREFQEKLKGFTFPTGTVEESKGSYIFYFIDKIKPIIEDLKKNIKNYTDDQIISKYETIHENAREWYNFIYAITMMYDENCIYPRATFEYTWEYYDSAWRARTVIGDIRDAAERGIRRIKRKKNNTSANIDEVKADAAMQAEQMKTKEIEAQIMKDVLKRLQEKTGDEEKQREPEPEPEPEQATVEATKPVQETEANVEDTQREPEPEPEPEPEQATVEANVEDTQREAPSEEIKGQVEPATTGGKYLHGIMRKKYTKKRRTRRRRM